MSTLTPTQARIRHERAVVAQRMQQKPKNKKRRKNTHRTFRSLQNPGE